MAIARKASCPIVVDRHSDPMTQSRGFREHALVTAYEVANDSPNKSRRLELSQPTLLSGFPQSRPLSTPRTEAPQTASPN